MTFEDFRKKLGDKYSPDDAYKHYLTIRLAVLEAFVRSLSGMEAKAWDEMEERIFKEIINDLKG